MDIYGSGFTLPISISIFYDSIYIHSYPYPSIFTIYCPYSNLLGQVRLGELGVSEEYLEVPYEGLVAFVKENRSWIPELVSAILPSDEEVAEVVLESKSELRAYLESTVRSWVEESVLWLQWLMFLGDPVGARDHLSNMSSRRGVCGAVWGHNDIAYRCRTCEHDPTCAICVPCFQNGNHKDHDYSIIYTGGGCCDCGDVTAWKREGFCSKHQGAEQIQPLPEEYVKSVGPVLDAVLHCWKSKLVMAESICQENLRPTASVQKKVANELSFVIIEMLLEFCKDSESLLSFVSRSVISLVGLLEILVKAEGFLSGDVTKKLHELLLKLLGEPTFKYEFAKVFLSYYPLVVHDILKEGTEDALKKHLLLSTFSVQIFTVPTLTPRLVKEMNLLAVLLGCLEDIFVYCAGDDGRLQVSKWGNIYETTIRVVEDIRFAMSHAVVPKYIINERRDILRTWMKLLSFLQGMSPLKRETGLHIDEENENTNCPFVLSHSVANIHSLLVDGAFSASAEIGSDVFLNNHEQDVDEGDNARHAKVGRLTQESSVGKSVARSTGSISASGVEVNSDMIPSSVKWLTYECLKAIENSLEVDNASRVLSSSSTSGNAVSNFLDLKKTYALIRKGFCGLTSTSEDQKKERSSFPHGGFHMDFEIENSKGIGQDHRTMVPSETNSASSDDNLMEVVGSAEVDPLRLLSWSEWPNIIYDVSSQDVSVHITLHRLLSLLIQRAMKRCYSELPNMNTVGNLIPSSTNYDFFAHILGSFHLCGFSGFVMEHPLRNRVFCAQVHAGMWKKNGDAAILSSEWYRTVRWSEQGLELDLFLLQCCAALAPADFYVNRIIERFALADYMSLKPERSNEYEPILVQEMLTLIIQIVQERRFSGLTGAENLRRELIHKLSIGDATRSQLVKSIPRDLAKLDKLQEILDAVAIYSNPSGFKQGMYSLRWICWKELDLYHPRWHSRDLQVAEERYTRYCGVSALTTQVPRWTKIYSPLKALAGLATCKTVLKFIRSVLFYAIFSDKLTEARASDVVLLTSLHLLALALDICFQHRESGDFAFYNGGCSTMLAFAVEKIHEGLSYGAGEQSLLSLLVSLMRIHRKESLENFVEAGNCDLSSLIESLLKKFGELDSQCMMKLQELAPEVVIHISQSNHTGEKIASGSASDGEIRKAKARERQAAILAKMKAEQSKFLSSINSVSEVDSKNELEESNSDDEQDLEETVQDVCSLCHNPNSKNPVSFLILLQKSRILRLIDSSPPSWDKSQQLSEDHISVPKNKAVGMMPTPAGLGGISPTQLALLAQNAVDEFSNYAQAGEVNAVIEFLQARFPSLKNTQFCAHKDDNVTTVHSFDTLEEDLYFTIREEMQKNLLISDCREQNKKCKAVVGVPENGALESVLLGKYIATLSRVSAELTSASGSASVDKVSTESTSQIPYDGFGPMNCDGIYLSSCGHAVHQRCLDRYLSSLRERHVRRIVFEGGHIVDPDQGEFLCPVCRRLANSTLPSLSGDFASDFLKRLSQQTNGKTERNLESVCRVLLKMYFPNTWDKFSGSSRVNLAMIMWDTFKYSLVSMEIAARCGRCQMTPNYSLSALYEELKSSSGFILSLLLKIVRSVRGKNFLHLLQRFRGIQLFAGSLCTGYSMNYTGSTDGHGGNMSSIWKHAEEDPSSPDTQFWNRAADPILADDAFSSLMWILFVFQNSFIMPGIIIVPDSFVLCYFHNSGVIWWIKQYFVSNYVDPSSNMKDMIQRLSFPYLRRFAAPFCDPDYISSAFNDKVYNACDLIELNEIQELEKMFKIPPLDFILKDQVLRSVANGWFKHFCREYEMYSFHGALHSTPAVPFMLMRLPRLYQDLLQRYIKQHCVDCDTVLDDPALCLLCGRLCSPGWKLCCRDNGCQSHAVVCGAGTGVFLLIKRTTILLQRCARQAPWPSLYLDAFGEEDHEMHRGKPLYLNEERYAALTYMVASHGLDRSSKVLGQTTVGAFFLM
ncbi:hypothetical protein K2173_001869 [Erythroxylum novogranatense]|uniref:E3 ubiquitin-protein ligase n=1 Tax=Erythroxylum novogranatense TaxID=1862640 RepID=A0AAV8SNX3_9ROSI|nr:hypothetical protein K2173_001869 [Erythroxylum novogranatense]